MTSDEILATLKAFGVVHASSIVVEAEPTGNPNEPRCWFASGPAKRESIDAQLHRHLIELGATEKGDRQTICVRDLNHSVQCAACALWIYCDAERDASCLCEAAYSVRLVEAPYITTLARLAGRLCAACGKDYGMQEWSWASEPASSHGFDVNGVFFAVCGRCGGTNPDSRVAAARAGGKWTYR
jgi:hypothetical protein